MSSPTRRVVPPRTLMYSAPMQLAIAAVALIAAIVLLLIVFIPPGSPPAMPSDTGSPTASATLTASPNPTPTPGTATPLPTASVAPTAEPTAAWTGLTWSQPVTPAFTINLFDLVPWGEGYVAVGQVRSRDAAFFSSPDGTHWTVRYQVHLNGEQVPRHLAAVDGTLFAFGGSTDAVPLIWKSNDGAHWSAVTNASWADAWKDHLLIGVAGGPHGLVAIGNARAGEHDELFTDPIVLHSSDGMSWTPTTLEGAGDLSVVRDVIGFRDRYAILGGEEIGPVTGMGTPKAWWSMDGATWKPAAVTGARAGDNEFRSNAAVAGSDGLLAFTDLLCAGCPPINNAWKSEDARSWQRASEAGAAPPFGIMAGDGDHIVVLATSEGWAPIGSSPAPYPGLTQAWVSTNAVTWRAMSLSHPMTDQVEAWWVVPDGIVFAGVRSFWFASADAP